MTPDIATKNPLECLKKTRKDMLDAIKQAEQQIAMHYTYHLEATERRDKIVKELAEFDKAIERLEVNND